jgi:hypothetical protein
MGRTYDEDGKVNPQRKSFVPIQEEMQIGGEADQSGGAATS